MTDQQVFDDTYITSIEVCSVLQIKRPSLMTAIKTGRLPKPIYIDVNGRHLLSLWDRAKLEPVLASWRKPLITDLQTPLTPETWNWRQYEGRAPVEASQD